jgi:hypothetical protein
MNLDQHLHRDEADLPSEPQHLLKNYHQKRTAFPGFDQSPSSMFAPCFPLSLCSSSSSIYYARENGSHRAYGYAKLFTDPPFHPIYTKESPTAVPNISALAPLA